MTSWYSDNQESARAFIHATSSWTTKGIPAWASAFCSGAPLWTTLADQDSGNDISRSIVLIDYSELSQFDTVLSLLKNGADLPDALVCLALSGSKFRGQRHRPWSALAGNLHLTAYYRLGLPARDIQTALTMIPAISSAQAITEVSDGQILPGIKWVNDIMVERCKVSGVLTATQLSGEIVDGAVFGIGMNIKEKPEIEPTPFVKAAGNLGMFYPVMSDALPEMFHAVVRFLDSAVEDLRNGRRDKIFEMYRRYSAFVGREVQIWPEGTEDWLNTPPIARGKVKRLHPDLSLEMEGTGQIVRSGRMALMD
ncbi:MAG TPA: hypothetical protein PJ991_02360 [Kiritimatiellia bacterium]|nr:hypothetical protein [Kiritimatiellia bacterium]